MPEDLKDAIEFVYERGRGESAIVTVDGKSYQPGHLELAQIHPDPLPPSPPLLSTFNVQTLSGLVDVLKSGIEDFEAAKVLIHIVDQATVNVTAKKSDDWMRRLVLVQCNAFKYEAFPFGRQMKQEDFIIAFQARFVPDDTTESDYAYVLRVASNLTASVVSVSDDTGINQDVVVKTSIAGRKEISLRPRVVLAPYRTFTEIAQPSSPFILRLHSQGTDEKPAIPFLSLTEADGGNWKKTAMDNIARFLETAQEIPVIC